jgi:glycosyltransferase involved in cell wall biosynthesis
VQKIILFLLIKLYIFRTKFITKRKPKEDNSVLFLAAFFNENAGFHWRVEQWMHVLKEDNIKVEALSAISHEEFQHYQNTNSTLFHIKYLKRRFKHVLKARDFGTVIVRRELLLYNDYGNLFLEKLLLRIHNNVILDFDDDIAYAKKEPRKINSLYGKLLEESGEKFTKSLSLYDRFIVPSEYLSNFILTKNNKIDVKSICILPTCVNYNLYQPKQYDIQNELVFGWIGGNHNQKLIDIVIPSLNEVSKSVPLKLVVISGEKYQNENASFEIVNQKWSLEKEVDLLLQIDIGLMPLFNTNEDKGKAGFKLIQYMGLGIVSIASDITINNEIILNEDFGFKVSSPDEWTTTILKAIDNKNKFSFIGSNARASVTEKYSFIGNKSKFINFLTNH